MIVQKKYLKIENPGVCPVEAFTVLGASLADTCDKPDIVKLLIGQFGSGIKQSIALLLREQLNPYVFLSSLKLEFFVKEKVVKDELSEKKVERICVNYSGKDENGKNKKSTEELTITTDFGRIIWDNVSMALREFVSNSIDFCLRKDGNWNNVNIEIVDESQVRAKSGYTRIFIPINREVEKFYFNLGKWFLHFSEPEKVLESVLLKNNRNMDDNEKPCIYRRGVFVRTFEHGDKKSLFDYNLNSANLDEARKMGDWDAQYYSARALATCKDDKILAKYFYILDSNEFVNYWEYDFDSYGMGYITNNKEMWETIFKRINGDRILCTPDKKERVERKGYQTYLVTQQIFDILAKTGIKTYVDVLTKNEAEGITILPPTDEMVSVCTGVWKFLERNHLTMNKEKCPIHSFVGIVDGGSDLRGFYRDDNIYIKHTESGPELFKIVIEEITHYISGAVDGSIDMQHYLLDIIYALNKENQYMEIL
jgi:hypothetical protein